MKKALEYETPLVEILYIDDCSFLNCLEFEKNYHIEHDVVANIDYFNKSIATVNTFNDNNYITVRYKNNNKEFVRLPKDHPLIKDGTYVNTNKDYKTYNNGLVEKQFHIDEIVSDEWVLGRLEKNKLAGSRNGFYGKEHTSKSKELIVKGIKEFYQSENGIKFRKVISENMSKTHKGRKKSDEHKKKIGRKGLIIIKNIITGENKRIALSELECYNSSEWVKATPPNHKGSLWYNNGVNEIKLKECDEIPTGYVRGRIKRNKL